MTNLIKALRHCLALLDPAHAEDKERIELISRLIRALKAFDTH